MEYKALLDKKTKLLLDPETSHKRIVGLKKEVLNLGRQLERWRRDLKIH